jgi:hypothetical protein
MLKFSLDKPHNNGYGKNKIADGQITQAAPSIPGCVPDLFRIDASLAANVTDFVITLEISTPRAGLADITGF